MRDLRQEYISAADERGRHATFIVLAAIPLFLAFLYPRTISADGWRGLALGCALVFTPLWLTVWLPYRVGDWCRDRAARKWDATHPRA